MPAWADPPRPRGGRGGHPPRGARARPRAYARRGHPVLTGGQGIMGRYRSLKEAIMADRSMFDCIGGAAVKNPQIAAAQLGPCVIPAGYVDGQWAWTPEQWDLFPGELTIRISVIPGSAEALSAHVADTERGAYTSVQAAQ